MRSIVNHDVRMTYHGDKYDIISGKGGDRMNHRKKSFMQKHCLSGFFSSGLVLSYAICFTICFTIFTIVFFEYYPVCAASADITISSDREDYFKGDYVDIYIDIEADAIPGDFEGYLLYSQDILEYVSGPDIASGGEGIIRIEDSVASQQRNNRRYALKFRVIDTGTAELTLRDGPELYELEDGYLMSVSVNELKIKCQASKTASDDNSLAVLKVSPGTLNPSFSKVVKEYSINVDAKTEKVIVSAAASDINADVQVSGNQNLKPGVNRIEIKVTAENGESTVYVINCTKEAGDDGNGADDRNGQNGDGPDADGIGRDGQNPDRTSDVINEIGTRNGIRAVKDGDAIKLITNNEYTVAEADDSIEIPSGYKKTSMLIDGISIPVYASDDPDAFMLMLLKNSNGEKALYSYDRTEKTLQRYHEKSGDTVVKHIMTDSIEALELANSYEKSLNTLTLIIAVLSGIVMSLLIILIRMALKNKGDGLD